MATVEISYLQLERECPMKENFVAWSSRSPTISVLEFASLLSHTLIFDHKFTHRTKFVLPTTTFNSTKQHKHGIIQNNDIRRCLPSCDYLRHL